MTLLSLMSCAAAGKCIESVRSVAARSEPGFVPNGRLFIALSWGRFSVAAIFASDHGVRDLIRQFTVPHARVRAHGSSGLSRNLRRAKMLRTRQKDRLPGGS